MSRADLWNTAAEAMRDDDDPRWRAVGDWLRAEAWVHESMEPLTELMNVAMESAGGPKSYLRFGRNEAGDPKLLGDTSGAATAVALIYLGRVS